MTKPDHATRLKSGPLRAAAQQHPVCSEVTRVGVIIPEQSLTLFDSALIMLDFIPEHTEEVLKFRRAQFRDIAAGISFLSIKSKADNT